MIGQTAECVYRRPYRKMTLNRVNVTMLSYKPDALEQMRITHRLFLRESSGINKIDGNIESLNRFDIKMFIVLRGLGSRKRRVTR